MECHLSPFIFSNKIQICFKFILFSSFSKFKCRLEKIEENDQKLAGVVRDLFIYF